MLVLVGSSRTPQVLGRPASNAGDDDTNLGLSRYVYPTFKVPILGRKLLFRVQDAVRSTQALARGGALLMYGPMGAPHAS